MPSYPDKLEIKPLTRPPHATVRVPGSKSITNRALVLAALSAASRAVRLARRACTARTPRSWSRRLQALGFRRSDRIGPTPRVRQSPARPDELDSRRRRPTCSSANSGTTMRFLTALVSLGHGRYRLDGVPRMRERPIEDLLDALRQLGVHARSEAGNGCPPVVVEADGLRGRPRHAFEGDVSSQFLSGLLMAPRSPAEPSPSRSTARWSPALRRHDRAHDATVGRLQVERRTGVSTFQAPTVALRYQSRAYAIEPDASAASYFFAAAAITGGRVPCAGLTRTTACKATSASSTCWNEMGCHVEQRRAGTRPSTAARSTASTST